MQNSIVEGLTHVDLAGRVIIGAIIAIALAALGVVLSIRGRYASLRRDLRESTGRNQPLEHVFLSRIVRERREAAKAPRQASVRGIVESAFRNELGPLLAGERFVRKSTSLVVLLAILGGFYGLTKSIGRLAQVASADVSNGSDVVSWLTKGLNEAMSGIIVAFATSSCGILAAVALMLLGIAFSVTDERASLILEMETYLERIQPRESAGPQEHPPLNAYPVLGKRTEGLELIVAGLGDSVATLDRAVARFDAALQSFATSTRDFREFNAHLKDNVQRMSVTFADFSEDLRTRVERLRSVDRS